MNTRTIVYTLWFISLAAIASNLGCSKDSSSNPADPGSNSIPTVVPHWVGTATASTGTNYQLTALLGQDNDKVSAICVWNDTRDGTNCVKYYNGTVASTRRVALTGNRSCGPSDWQLDTWNAALSSNGDTLSGTFTKQSTSAALGSFKLIKKSSSQSFPSVAANWKGVVKQNPSGIWDVTVTATQGLDLLVTEWSYATGSGPIKTTTIGSISPARTIQLKDISAEFSDPRQATQWTTMTGMSLVLSARGDTISGTWVDNVRNTGTVLLGKQ
jgi:hypothetical protein